MRAAMARWPCTASTRSAALAGGAGAHQLGQAAEFFHIAGGDGRAVAFHHRDGRFALGVGRRLPQREGALFHQGDEDGVGIAAMHFGRGDPVQMRQPACALHRSAPKMDSPGFIASTSSTWLIRRAAVAGDVDLGNAEAGIGDDGVDATADGMKAAADHAAGQQRAHQHQHQRRRRTRPSWGASNKPADTAVLRRGRGAVPGCTLGRSRLPRAGAARVARTGPRVLRSAHRSHEASSTIQRHNFA